MGHLLFIRMNGYVDFHVPETQLELHNILPFLTDHL